MARKRSGTLIPVLIGAGALVAYIVISVHIANKRNAPYLGTIYPPPPPSSYQPQAAVLIN